MLRTNPHTIEKIKTINKKYDKIEWKKILDEPGKAKGKVEKKYL